MITLYFAELSKKHTQSYNSCSYGMLDGINFYYIHFITSTYVCMYVLGSVKSKTDNNILMMVSKFNINVECAINV